MSDATVHLDVDPFSDDQAEQPGAMALLRAGVAATPELRAGLGTAIALSVANAAWRLVVPIALQQVLDHGLSGSGGVDIPFVLWASGAAAVVVLVLKRLGVRSPKRYCASLYTAPRPCAPGLRCALWIRRKKLAR